MTLAVQFTNVSRLFGEVKAVDRVSIDIQDGEFFSMLGPSGSGKTTCLRLIAGFEQPSAGSIRIHGEEAAGLPPYQRDVNTVFQDYALFPHMNVRDNVAYGLKVKGIGKAERLKRAEESLEMVALGGYSNTVPVEAAATRPIALTRLKWERRTTDGCCAGIGCPMTASCEGRPPWRLPPLIDWRPACGQAVAERRQRGNRAVKGRLWRQPAASDGRALSPRVEALAPAQGEGRLDRELIVRSETRDAHVASPALSLARGEDAPLGDLGVVLRVAATSDALDVEPLCEDTAVTLLLALDAHVYRGAFAPRDRLPVLEVF